MTGSVIGFGCLQLNSRFAAQVSREPLGRTRWGEVVILELGRAVQKLVGIIALCLLTNTPTQADDISRVDSTERYPQLRSVLLQAEVAPFIVGFGGLIDYDFVRFPSQHLSTFGIRISVDHYQYGGPGGESSYSPALDYNILLRHTASGSVVRFDILFNDNYYFRSTTIIISDRFPL